MKLLQMTWAELLTVQLAYHSIPFTGKLIFAKEFWLDEKLAKECGASELFTHVSKFIYFDTDRLELCTNDIKFDFHCVVRPNYPTAGTFDATQRRIFAAESTDFVKLREDIGQSNCIVQIPRLNSHFTQRMRLFAKVKDICTIRQPAASYKCALFAPCVHCALCI